MLNYYIAVSTGEAEPFPHTSITNTSIHYPQCVFFRLAFIPPTIFYSIVVKTFFDMVNIMSQLSKQKPIGLVGYISGVVAMIGLGIVSSTMENGKEDDPWHVLGALLMFIGQSLNIFIYTEALYNVRRYYPKIISSASMVIKIIICIVMLITMIVCGVCCLSPHFKLSLEKSLGLNDYGDIIEYVCLFSFNFYYIT